MLRVFRRLFRILKARRNYDVENEKWTEPMKWPQSDTDTSRTDERKLHRAFSQMVTPTLAHI